MPKYKHIISDSIYKNIHLHPLTKQIIDTPQFQRLRNLRQLGVASWVYPSATHSRFEHSIGVSHLAYKFARTLQNNQPELGITDDDILCVTIAGLCHDLGHGPYSHLFDNEFIKNDALWSHEKGSVQMFKWLIEDNHIDMQGLSIPFICNLIQGTTEPYSFLQELINNSRSGLDVDKLDYLVRDAYMTGVGISMGIDVDRIIEMARVLPGEQTICFPEKCIDMIFGVFHARMSMHNAVYQHKTVKAVEFMIRDILHLANDFLLFKSSKTGQMMRMSDAINDMTVYQQLTDSILYLIERSFDPNLKPAQDLIKRLYSRDLYKFCFTMTVENFPTQMPDHIIVEHMTVHHGKGTMTNPLDGIKFFNKAFQIVQVQYSNTVIPKAMGVETVRIFSKKNNIRYQNITDILKN